MTKSYNIKLAFIFSLLAVHFQYVLSQCALVEIPMQQQVEHSNLIVEGEVVSKKSFWDLNHKNIYTVNTVKVYKVFKGSPVSIIEVITRGGVVGTDIEIVTPSLKLGLNQQGVFMLNPSKINLSDQSSELKAEAYSSLQGFYSYDLVSNKVVNVFRRFESIENIFYSKVKELTHNDFSVVRENIRVKSINEFYKSSNQKAVAITGISPTSVTAGTKTQVTISGSGFGTSGTVGFFNADDGGATYTSDITDPFPTPIATQIVSWSDSQIVVEVPDNAGTGTVKVTNTTDMTSAISSQTLTVDYAEINVYSDFLTTGTNYRFQTQHAEDANFPGTGGYTWQMYTDFDSNANAKAAFLRAFETWRCETKINWTLGTPTTTNEIASDGINVIRFDIGSELEVGILGRCTSRYSGCGEPNNPDNSFVYVRELDIVFDSGTNWGYGPANTSFPKVDFESVAVHELGHGHQLGHVINSNAIMHFNIGQGVNRKSLSANDILAGNDVQNRSENNTILCTNPSVNSMTPYSGNCSLSIAELQLEELIDIYPNPSYGKFYVKNLSSHSFEKVDLFDLGGRVVKEFKIDNTSNLNQLELKGLSKGFYIVKIYSGNFFVTKKITVL